MVVMCMCCPQVGAYRLEQEDSEVLRCDRRRGAVWLICGSTAMESEIKSLVGASSMGLPMSPSICVSD